MREEMGVRKVSRGEGVRRGERDRGSVGVEEKACDPIH